METVLPGMDAAFVDIGLDRNGFLAVSEVVVPEAHAGRSRKIGDLVKAGKELLVQVTRDPMGGKGPRLTMEVGIPGRYVVYLPGGKGVGVSRRLDQGERERLRTIAREAQTRGRGADSPNGSRRCGPGVARARSALSAESVGRSAAAGAGCAGARPGVRRGGVGRKERP